MTSSTERNGVNTAKGDGVNDAIVKRAKEMYIDEEYRFDYVLRDVIQKARATQKQDDLKMFEALIYKREVIWKANYTMFEDKATSALILSILNGIKEDITSNSTIKSLRKDGLNHVPTIVDTFDK